MYIKSLKICNYKNFYRNNIDLTKNINTIIGENGTGKTNLFYAIRGLLDKNFRLFLSEDSFSYQLKIIKGNWIIISCEFQEVEEDYNTLILNPDEQRNAIYSFIFRPKKEIRMKLYELSEEYKIKDGDEKLEIKKEIEAYIEKIDIKNDYEVIRTVDKIFDFLNEDKYKEIVGDFDNLVFPDSDVQEDKKNIGNKANDVNDIINVTYIPAIRDVNNELTHENNFFIKMVKEISQSIKEEKWNEIYEKFNDINMQLNAIEEFNGFINEIENVIKDTVGEIYNSNVTFDINMPISNDNIIKYFSLKGKNEEKNFNLNNNSLGENNVVYLALKLKESQMEKGHTKKFLNIILIEEPEAHLHKHLQQSLFEGIKNNEKYQIFLSTHSVHISESADIESAIVLGKSNKHTEIFIPSKGLDNEEIRKITRFLDVTRLPILFAKNVILVEGEAELILIPFIVKMKYGIDLYKYGISIISMDSCFFDMIAMLFEESRIRKKCSILTDLDKDYTKDRKFIRRERLSCLRVSRMKKKYEQNKFVKIFTNEFTFEIEFFKDNITVLKKLLEKNKYFKTTEKMKKELDDEDIAIKYNRIIKIAEKAGKGWLAMDVTEYIQKEKIDIIIPEYIIDALIHLFDDEQYYNAIKKILETYSYNNNIEFNDLIEKRTEKIDKFMEFLIERYKEINEDDITKTV